MFEEFAASGYRVKLPSEFTGVLATTKWRLPSALRSSALTWMSGRPEALEILTRFVSVSVPWIPPAADRS